MKSNYDEALLGFWLVLFLAVFLFAVCGCGDEGAGRYGFVLKDRTDSVTVEELDIATDHLLAVIGGSGGRLREENLEVIVEPRVLPLDGSPGPCKYEPSSGKCAAGLSYIGPDRIRVWRYVDCFYRGAFVHELIHFFQWWRDEEMDEDHSSTKWWDTPVSRGSVEDRAYETVVQECPEGT